MQSTHIPLVYTSCFVKKIKYFSLNIVFQTIKYIQIFLVIYTSCNIVEYFYLCNEFK